MAGARTAWLGSEREQAQLQLGKKLLGTVATGVKQGRGERYTGVLQSGPPLKLYSR